MQTSCALRPFSNHSTLPLVLGLLLLSLALCDAGSITLTQGGVDTVYTEGSTAGTFVSDDDSAYTILDSANQSYGYDYVFYHNGSPWAFSDGLNVKNWSSGAVVATYVYTSSGGSGGSGSEGDVTVYIDNTELEGLVEELIGVVFGSFAALLVAMALETYFRK